MKQEINLVVTCYAKRKKLQWQKQYPLSTIETSLSTWCNAPTETISIRTYYKDAHLLPVDAMPSAVDINLKELSVRYSVVSVTNNKMYRNITVMYSCLDDLLFSVLNYLTTTQETKMTYKDMLINFWREVK